MNFKNKKCLDTDSGTVRIERLNLTIEYKNDFEFDFLKMIEEDHSVIDVQRMDRLGVIDENNEDEIFPSFIVLRADGAECVTIIRKSELDLEDIVKLSMMKRFLLSKGYAVGIITSGEANIEVITEQLSFFSRFTELEANIH